MRWYYATENGDQIPCDEPELARLITNGVVKPDTLVWNETMADWKNASQVRPDWFKFGGTLPRPIVPVATANLPRPSPGYPAPIPYQVAPTDPLALTSMICGIVAVLTMCLYIGAIPGIAAVIFGHMARRRIANGSSPPNGNGMAIAGLITGYIAIAMTVAFILFVVGVLVLAPST